MSSRNLPLRIIALLVGVQLVRLYTVWGRLPERVASHFNAAGTPDGWSARGSNFLTLALVQAGVLALLLTAHRWSPRAPYLLNLPHRHHFLAKERQAETLPRLAVWMAWFGVAITAMMVSLNEMMIRANLSGGSLPQPAHRIVFWGFLLFVGVWLYLFHRAFRPPPAQPAPPVR